MEDTPSTSNKYSPEEARAMRERAANKGATSRYESNNDAFMSPKWADVDKNLSTPTTDRAAPVGLVKTTVKPEDKRTYGAPNINNISAQAAARSQPLDSSYTGLTRTPKENNAQSGSYRAGYKAGQKISQLGTRTESLRQSMGVRSGRSATKETGVARYGAGRNRMSASGEKTSIKETTMPPPRGGYILFFFVLGIVIGKDIIDIISALLDLVGVGLTATVIGAPIGAAIGVLSEIIDKIVGLLVDFIMLTYFWFIGGKFALRFVITSIGAIIDAIPGLDVLPLATIMFVAAFLVGRVAEKALNAVAKVAPIVNTYQSVKQRFSKA